MWADVITFIDFKSGNLIVFSSLHRYSFLMSRTVSSVLALVLFYIILVAWKLEIFRYASAAVFILVGSLTFFTSAGMS